jgi:formiminotetrahydrofolate cyclodeaminase
MTDTPTDDHFAGTALAGSTIAIGLFNVLIDKKIISREEALSILRETRDFLENSSNAVEGARITASIYERILNGK